MFSAHKLILSQIKKRKVACALGYSGRSCNAGARHTVAVQDNNLIFDTMQAKGESSDEDNGDNKNEDEAKARVGSPPHYQQELHQFLKERSADIRPVKPSDKKQPSSLKTALMRRISDSSEKSDGDSSLQTTPSAPIQNPYAVDTKAVKNPFASLIAGKKPDAETPKAGQAAAAELKGASSGKAGQSTGT